MLIPLLRRRCRPFVPPRTIARRDAGVSPHFRGAPRAPSVGWSTSAAGAALSGQANRAPGSHSLV